MNRDRSSGAGGRSTRKRLWHPPGYTVGDVRAVQALARGEAGPQEQKRALDWIINTAAQTYDEPFYPDNARVTDYVLGRRSVGLALVKLIRLKPAAVERPTTDLDETS